MMISVLLVAIGGFFGAMARYGLNFWITKQFSARFPFGTLTANILGAFLLGFLIGSDPAPGLEKWLGTGFLGAFTTFSTVHIETFTLFLEKKRTMLAGYLFITYAGGIFAAFLGLSIGIH